MNGVWSIFGVEVLGSPRRWCSARRVKPKQLLYGRIPNLCKRVAAQAIADGLHDRQRRSGGNGCVDGITWRIRRETPSINQMPEDENKRGDDGIEQICTAKSQHM
jgi:hypothetical protein